MLFFSFISACASSPVLQSDKAYPTGHDLLSERSRAIELYQAKKFTESLAIYDRLVLSVPEDAELWFRKGNIHARIAQPELAIKAYQESLVRNQKYFKAWRNMSAIQLRQAANSMTQLMSILPGNHVLYAESLNLTKEILKLIGDKPNSKAIESPTIEDTERRETEVIQ